MTTAQEPLPIPPATDAERCRWAINFGGPLHTRCMLAEATHGGGVKHTGKGLAQFDDQRINWFPGDRREYRTDRTDDHAWEGVEGRLVDGKWVMERV